MIQPLVYTTMYARCASSALRYCLGFTNLPKPALVQTLREHLAYYHRVVVPLGCQIPRDARLSPEELAALDVKFNPPRKRRSQS